MMVPRRQKVLLLAIASVGSILVLLNWPRDWSAIIPMVECRNTEFVLAMAKRATPDRFIVLALVDSSFVDMAINLYETSFRPNAINNFLFVGAGRKACEALENASLPCFHYVEDKDTAVASVYRSPDFIRKMNIRTDMILDALQYGFTVLHTDLDVVFLRNPIPELKAILLKADVAAMWDSINYNAGFIAVRPTWYSQQIYGRMKLLTQKSAKTDDQSALNKAINMIGKMYKNSDFKAVALDKKRYLCGVDYFERGSVRRLFPGGNCSACVVVHNNWIVSKAAKTYRFKEHHMWHYDKDSYYSSDAQLYLSYQNPVTWNTSTTSLYEELEALKAALAYGELLGRVVILPRFHCVVTPPKSRSKAPRTTTPNPKISFEECPLNSILNVTAFDAVFEDSYRESTFLDHPLVPDSARSGQSPLYVFHVDPTASSSVSTKDVHVLQLRNETLGQLRASNHRVLRFRSLYRSTPSSSNDEETRLFGQKIKTAFRKGSYRQL